MTSTGAGEAARLQWIVASLETDVSTLPAGTVLGGNLEVLSVLGQGGFGITYLAHDHDLDTEVVIKEFFPAAWAKRKGLLTDPIDEHASHFNHFLGRFLDEARIAARIHHEALVRVHRYFRENGTGYFVMPWYDGETLTNEVRRSGRPSLERINRVMLPLLDGLELLHSNGLIHRDVKPENIYIKADGSPVLLDFGAARVCSSTSPTPMTAVLSPGYAPPEQYSANGKQGPHTDVYAIGSVLFWLLSGRHPTDAALRVTDSTGDSTIEKQLVELGVATRIASVVDAAMALRVEKRIPDIAEFRRRLTQPVDKPAVNAPRPSRSRWTLGFVASLMAAAIILFLALGPRWGNQSDVSQATVPVEAKSVPATQPTTAQDTSEAPSFSRLENQMEVGRRGAIVRSRASSQSVMVERLPAGSMIEVKESIIGEEVSNTDVWYHVTTRSGATGYVSSSLVAPISETVQFQSVVGMPQEEIARRQGCKSSEDMEVSFAALDLDGHRPEELVIMGLDRGACGSSGCSFVNIRVFDSSLKPISGVIQCTDLKLSATISRGMSDLICVQSYAGIESQYVFSWDGERYAPVTKIGEDDQVEVDLPLCETTAG